MPKPTREFALFTASLCVWAYFAFLFLNFTYFKITWVGLGVLQELITLPITALHVVLLFIAFVWWFKDPRLNRLVFLNAILLSVSNALLINQLFF